ncbi:MAG: hypothetical protein ACYTFI_15805, partial [Planctomycetota bacterium]
MFLSRGMTLSRHRPGPMTVAPPVVAQMTRSRPIDCGWVRRSTRWRGGTSPHHLSLLCLDTCRQKSRRSGPYSVTSLVPSGLTAWTV